MCAVNSDCDSAYCKIWVSPPSPPPPQPHGRLLESPTAQKWDGANRYDLPPGVCQAKDFLEPDKPDTSWDEDSKGLLVSNLPPTWSYPQNGFSCASQRGKWLWWQGDEEIPDADWLGCQVLGSASIFARPLANGVLPSDPSRLKVAPIDPIPDEKKAQMVKDGCYRLNRYPVGTTEESVRTWSTTSEYSTAVSQSFSTENSVSGGYGPVSASAGVAVGDSSSNSARRETNNVGAVVERVVKLAKLENACLQPGTGAGPEYLTTFKEAIIESLEGYRDAQNQSLCWGDITKIVDAAAYLVQFGASLPTRWEYSYYQRYSMRASFTATSTMSTEQASKAISASVSAGGVGASASASSTTTTTDTQEKFGSDTGSSLDTIESRSGDCNWPEPPPPPSPSPSPEENSTTDAGLSWTKCEIKKFRQWAGRLPTLAVPGVVDALSLFSGTDLTREGIRKDTIDLQNIVTQYYADTGGWFNYLYKSDLLEAQQADETLQKINEENEVKMEPPSMLLVSEKDVIDRRLHLEAALRNELKPGGSAAGKSYRLEGPITFMDCTKYPTTQFSSSFCTDTTSGANSVKEQCIDSDQNIDACLLRGAGANKTHDDSLIASSMSAVDCKCPQYDVSVCKAAAQAAGEVPPNVTEYSTLEQQDGPRNKQGACTKGCGDCEYGMACVGPPEYQQGQCTSFTQPDYTWALPTPSAFCSARIPGTKPTFIFKVVGETIKLTNEDQRMDADAIVRCEFVYE